MRVGRSAEVSGACVASERRLSSGHRARPSLDGVSWFPPALADSTVALETDLALTDSARSESQPRHRTGGGPVPVRLDRHPIEHLVEGVHEEVLAALPRSTRGAAFGFLDRPEGKADLVDAIAAVPTGVLGKSGRLSAIAAV